MRIATLTGIPIRLHWSFFVLVAFYGITALASQGFLGLVETIVLMGGLFGSVVLHELGHALAARSFGIQTAHITLYPFGGIAAMKGLPEDPRQEAIIAVAGPAVNAALFVLFGGKSRLVWHGISRVFPRTAPAELQMTPGRLSITMRKN